MIGQTDDDSLPPYTVLDPLLHCYVELDQSVEEIIAEGFPVAIRHHKALAAAYEDRMGRFRFYQCPHRSPAES